jgi:hypothetical protein
MLYTQIENAKAKYPASMLGYFVELGIIENVDATPEELNLVNIVPVPMFAGQIPVDGNEYKVDIVQQPDGSWAHELVQIEISQEQYQNNVAVQTQAVKADRNRLLVSCDWTQLADVNLSQTAKQAWNVYRQLLRDIPTQTGFPFTIEWPQPPNR